MLEASIYLWCFHLNIYLNTKMERKKDEICLSLGEESKEQRYIFSLGYLRSSQKNVLHLLLFVQVLQMTTHKAFYLDKIEICLYLISFHLSALVYLSRL